MTTPRTGFLQIPELSTFVIIAVNVLVYLATCMASGGLAPTRDVLASSGAIYSATLQNHEYWRLVAYAFLHLDIVHILSNMICLLSWGGLLERRVGTTYFLVIYAASGIGAAIVSIFLHQTPFMTAGASGAISGVVGGLFALWVLQRIEMSALFFLVNIGLNVVLMAGPLQIDWQAHLGGFVVGMLTCAVLDLVERGFALALRTKFPEFIKLNVVLVGLGMALIVYSALGRDMFRLETSWNELLMAAAAFLVFLKLVDMALLVRRGLAVLIVAFAVFYAVLPLVAAGWIGGRMFTLCRTRAGGLFDPAGFVCSEAALIPYALSVMVFALTILLLWRELRRGFADVGFLANRFRADRNRTRGL